MCWCGQNIDALVGGGGVRIPSEYCQGALEQGTELANHPGVDPAFARIYPKKAANKEMRQRDTAV